MKKILFIFWVLSISLMLQSSTIGETKKPGYPPMCIVNVHNADDYAFVLNVTCTYVDPQTNQPVTVDQPYIPGQESYIFYLPFESFEDGAFYEGSLSCNLDGVYWYDNSVPIRCSALSNVRVAYGDYTSLNIRFIDTEL